MSRGQLFERVPLADSLRDFIHSLWRVLCEVFECVVPFPAVVNHLQSVVNSIQCHVVKDYKPSVANIYAYFRFFEYLRVLEHQCLRLRDPQTGDFLIVNASRAFIEGIQPSNSALAFHLRKYLDNNPEYTDLYHAWGHDVVSEFQRILVDSPSMRVHYAPSLPRDLVDHIKPVSFNISQQLCVRPNQPTSGLMFCAICFLFFGK